MDTDRDGYPDRETRRLFSSPTGTTSVATAARVSAVGSNTLVWRWEDNVGSGAADYNDYIATTEVRQCGGPRFEPATLGSDPTCTSTCSTSSCPAAWVGRDASRFRVAAGLLIDEDAAEVQYEPNGRKMLLDVALHSDFRPPELGGATLTAAVCPQLVFNFRSSPANYGGHYGAWQFGDGSCAPSSGGSAPTCSAGISPPSKQLPISLSVFGKSTPDSCSIDKNASATDVFTITESSTCAPNTNMRHFELRLDQIDAAIANPLEAFGQLNSQAIIAQLAEVKIYVFVGFGDDGREFHCPSGVGAWLAPSSALDQIVQPGIAHVLEFGFRPDPNTHWSSVPGMSVRAWQQ